jgi:hypothetical protein
VGHILTIWGSKKSWPPRKKPKKLLILCFASIQNITSQTTRISDTLVFLCIGAII